MGTCNVYCRQKKGAMLVFDVWGGLFCFWLFICFPCIYLYFPLILLRFLVSFQWFLRFFHLFSLLFFFNIPFILLRFLLSLQYFLRFCGLFLTIRCTFCYIPCSCFADFTFFFNFTLAILKSFPFTWFYVGLISLYFV